MRKDELIADKIWSRVLNPANFEIWRQSESQTRDLVWSLTWGQIAGQTRTAVEHEVWDQIRDDADEQQADG